YLDRDPAIGARIVSLENDPQSAATNLVFDLEATDARGTAGAVKGTKLTAAILREHDMVAHRLPALPGAVQQFQAVFGASPGGREGWIRSSFRFVERLRRKFRGQHFVVLRHQAR